MRMETDNSSGSAMGGTAWYGLGVVAVVLVLAGAWSYFGGGAGGPASVGNAGTQMSLKDLLAQGGSQKCAFSSVTDSFESSGTVYVADGQMRGDFTSVTGGQPVMSHMVVTDNTSYVWTDNYQQGMMMSFDAMTAGQESGQSAVDPNALADYSCEPWEADAGIFVLPDGIYFLDIDSITGTEDDFVE